MKDYRSGNVVKIVAVAFSLLTPGITLSQINQNNQMKNTNVLVLNTTDRDLDGVADSRDLERNTPRGWDVDAFGVSLDVDKDGVADTIDREKRSPLGVAVDEYGVAIDAEKATESSDADTAAAYSGIPAVGNPAALVGPELMAELEVVLNSVNDLIGGRDLLANDLPNLADNAGADKFLPKFSGRRIRSVKKKLLRSYKITVDRLPTTGYGELAGVASPKSVKTTDGTDNNNIMVSAVNISKKEKKTQATTIRQ